MVVSKFSNAEVKACDSVLARGSWFDNYVNGNTQKIGEWEIGKSIAYFTKEVPMSKRKTTHSCYHFVKKALYAGGFSEYGDREAYTFTKKVSENPKSFKMIYDSGTYVTMPPQYGEKRVGDIRVFEYDKNSNKPFGHIEMYDGRDWVSDFRRADGKPIGVKSRIRVFRFPENGKVW